MRVEMCSLCSASATWSAMGMCGVAGTRRCSHTTSFTFPQAKAWAHSAERVANLSLGTVLLPGSLGVARMRCVGRRHLWLRVLATWAAAVGDRGYCPPWVSLGCRKPLESRHTVHAASLSAIPGWEPATAEPAW